ncbi:MAG: DNA methylase [Calditrichia bacterium]
MERFKAIQSAEDFLEYLEAPQKEAVTKYLHVNTPETSGNIPVYISEFWTARQRQAHSLHEISYRACFKPQLPSFFINRLTKPGQVVLDPFSGRGTTAIEAALLGRIPIANDINPLARILSEPRLSPPLLTELRKRLHQIPVNTELDADIDLSMFYHPQTLSELLSLRNYLNQRRENHAEDYLDRWIRMVATNRLSGHSPGFFSVYTLPPNQAVTPARQIAINQARNQTPQYKPVKDLIFKKSVSLLRKLTQSERKSLMFASKKAQFCNHPAEKMNSIATASIDLVVTSPPFLDVVQYANDNWLRCWFNQLDVDKISQEITICRTLRDWSDFMRRVFRELFRIVRPGGWVAFEVGEIRNKELKLEETVAPIGMEAGFKCVAILINQQHFTKTANIWGVRNNTRGTNSNRIVVFSKT